MSNALAIATVTATMQRLLQNALDASGPGAVSGAHVRPLRPGAAGAAGPDSKGIDLYLYEIAPNAALRNHDLPTRNSSATLVQRPMFAVDLHYVLSFYGDDLNFESHRMMAIAATTFHAHATLTRNAIRDTIGDPTFAAVLGQSNLADDIELVRLSPLVFSLEELSKFWSVLVQTPHAPSMAYKASVVLLESRDIPTVIPFARRSNLYFGPARDPLVDSLAPQIALVGDLLVVGGQHFKGDTTTVRIGVVDAIAPSTVTDTRLELTVPGTVRAGMQPLQVTRSETLRSSTAPARTFTRTSNMVALVIAPQIGGPAHRSVVQGSTLTLDVVPPLGRDQTVSLVLGDRSVTIEGDPHDTSTTSSITFTVPADLLPTGIDSVDLPLLVQVDGATSSLVDDTTAGSPGYAPSLHITRT